MERKSEKIGGLLVIQEKDNKDRVIKTIFSNYTPVARFEVNNLVERRLAAIELVERGICSQKIAAKICDFHRNTVFKLLRIKRLLGLQAALEDHRGLKHPLKYIGALRSHIKKLLRKYPDWSDQEIAAQATSDLNIEVSRSAVARIRTEKQDHQQAKQQPSKQSLLELSKIAEAIDQERFDERQLALNFEQDPQLKQQCEEFEKAESPRSENQSEQRFIERLQKGERNHFSGGLMHHLFLEEIGYEQIIGLFPEKAGHTYQSSDILSTLFFSGTQNIKSIEALKLVNASELGVLIGMNRSPDKEVMRIHLGNLAEQYRSTELIDRLARALLEHQRIDTEVFFIDGHFLPYYGLHVIAKGYYTVRRLAMKGNELYAISDLRGRPLFFITESNEIDFRPIISRAAEQLIGFGISRPILVFDRGGYGIYFFKELNNKADFVTWAKYVSETQLEHIPEKAFTVGLSVNGKKYLVAEQHREVKESIQTAQKEGRSEPAAITLRLVVLEEIESNKRVGVYTNNMNKPASDIAYYMLQRWGDSENFYKEMMAHFNLNYHPGYDIEELEKQPLVDNPDIPLIKKALAILNQEIKALEKEIEFLQAKLALRQDKRLATKRTKLQSELEEKKNEKEQFELKRAALPDKVSVVELLKGKAMSRCDLEKKKLYDLVQMIAFHSRERLVEIFKEYYDDPRDVKQVLDMITRQAGYVKLIGDTLVVILDWIERRKHREAAERLCQELNRKNIKLTGRLKVKLFFHISKVPHHGSQRVSRQGPFSPEKKSDLP
jgi:transposase/uncharacterized protein YlzI (FlbEa/FlbD family)